MKHFNTIFALLLLATSISFAAASPNSYGDREKYPIENENWYDSDNIDDFLQLTPKKIKEKTGEKLNLKEIIALKTAQRKVKKIQEASSPEGRNSKDQLVALLLAIFVGTLGIHRFYLGYTGIGILQLLTLGGCGIWSLIDLILIATGNLQPKYGYYDQEL